MVAHAGRFDPVRAAQALFFVNAAVWLLLAISGLIRFSGSAAAGPAAAVVVAILMLGNAAALLATGLLIGTRRRLWYYLALALLLVNIILTFTDQFGLLDLLTLLLDIGLLGLLIATRSHYHGKT